MTTMLVIDTTTRGLRVLMANVTRSETGLVVREALELPGLEFLTRGSNWRSPKDSGGLPVLLVGDGYDAQSSAGFVDVRGPLRRFAEVAVVGTLPMDRALRVHRPRKARLLGPVRFVAESSASNSNQRTASAVCAGLPLLAAADPDAILIAEGQSDYVRVYRLLPVEPVGTQYRGIARVEVADLDEEHRGDMFAPEAVARVWFRTALRYWTGQGIVHEAQTCVLRDTLESADKADCRAVRTLLESEEGAGLVARWATELLPPKEEPEPEATSAPTECLSGHPAWEHELEVCGCFSQTSES